MVDGERCLRDARVAPEVPALRPDYRALLIVVTGLTPADSSPATDALLTAAEDHARALVGQQPVEQLPHIAAWREAYRSFGAKPQRTRNSLEALTRRAGSGLPRVNALTDIYNAISVLHQLPVGGEDLSAYQGAPQLVRADGTEVFDTVADGQPAVEHPEAGEVVWRDDAGVTCRRWNWRQGLRTRLHDHTTTAVFILDALAPMTDDALDVAGEDLSTRFATLGADVEISHRTLGGEQP